MLCLRVRERGEREIHWLSDKHIYKRVDTKGEVNMRVLAESRQEATSIILFSAFSKGWGRHTLFGMYLYPQTIVNTNQLTNCNSQLIVYQVFSQDSLILEIHFPFRHNKQSSSFLIRLEIANISENSYTVNAGLMWGIIIFVFIKSTVKHKITFHKNVK